ncbi:MAG TPA: Dabb family protein [Sphingobacteriaceae bacterium]|nr:Dabb family protein [Sphingobacteriaceae bacterium]
MFVHHVYFWLKNPADSEEYSRLFKGLQSINKIEPKTLFHLGVPADTDRGVIDTSYAFSLLLIFNSLEEQEDYQNHPNHLKFVNDCSSLWSKVIVYDSIDIK